MIGFICDGTTWTPIRAFGIRLTYMESAEKIRWLFLDGNKNHGLLYDGTDLLVYDILERTIQKSMVLMAINLLEFTGIPLSIEDIYTMVLLLRFRNLRHFNFCFRQFNHEEIKMKKHFSILFCYFT